MEFLSDWLPLTDYSTKYKVSVSTLRRKIKSEDIQYRFEDGKYLILNCPPEAHAQHRPSLTSEVAASSTMAGASRASYFGPSSTTSEIEQRIQKARADLQMQQQKPSHEMIPPRVSVSAELPKEETQVTKNTERSEEPVLMAANRLLSELKKAYTQILQEREEQIMELKEEMADLKTLVKVLESENDKLRGFRQ